MKPFKLENEPKIKPGFITPENYFEDFSAKIVQQLPQEDSKIISLFTKRKTWFYSGAAAIIGLLLALSFYDNSHHKTSEIDTATLENYISYHTSVSDVDLVNLLSENDIQKMSMDLNIEDKTIEDELSTNKNLEHYLLK